MIQPAEKGYLELQTELEQTAASLFREQGPAAAEALLTDYATECAASLGFAYSELVDFLMLRYVVGDPEFARPQLPRIAAPTVPDK